MNFTPIGAIAHLRAGSVLEGISGTLQKIYDDVKSGSGQHGNWSMQNGTFVGDDGHAIKVTFKDRDKVPPSWAGRRMEIITAGGKNAKGVSVDEYQGKKSLLIYPTVEINFIDDSSSAPAPAPAPAPERRESAPAPAPPREDRSAPRQSERVPVKPDGQHVPIFGATCGMAINNAVAILSSGGHSLDYFRSPDFSADVWKIASDLIRVSQTLEKGVLAPGPKERRTESAPSRPPIDADNPDSYT